MPHPLPINKRSLTRCWSNVYQITSQQKPNSLCGKKNPHFFLQNSSNLHWNGLWGQSGNNIWVTTTYTFLFKIFFVNIGILKWTEYFCWFCPSVEAKTTNQKSKRKTTFYLVEGISHGWHLCCLYHDIKTVFSVQLYFYNRVTWENPCLFF